MFWKKKRIYLDIAAGISGNPSSPHTEGRAAKSVLENARTRIARLLEVQTDDIIFTSGATEANALAILGYVRAQPKGSHVLYLPTSHASIVENVKMLVQEGYEVEELPVKDYRVHTEVLAKMIRSNTILVSMDAVCGETGVIWNTREVAEVLRKGASPRALLHVDASQAPLTEKLTRAHFSADLLTFDISKVSSERGIGLLVVHRTIPITPLFRGGGQERGLRSGSEAPRLAEAFAEALTEANEQREVFTARAAAARAKLLAEITATIPNVEVQEGRAQSPNIINLSLVGRDTDYLLALLDEAGFALSSRSACETDSEEGSRAVLVLTGSVERAKATLRVSWGPRTSERELMNFARALRRAVGFIDSASAR